MRGKWIESPEPNYHKALPKETTKLLKIIIDALKAGEVRNQHTAKNMTNQLIRVKKCLDSSQTKSD
jgi:hypothetical protein